MRCSVVIENDQEKDSKLSKLQIFCQELGVKLELPGDQVRAGLAKAKKYGGRYGRPPRQIEMEKLKSLLAENHSYSRIARIMGVPYSTIIRRIRSLESQAEPGSSTESKIRDDHPWVEIDEQDEKKEA
jgi:hypothetical protein